MNIVITGAAGFIASRLALRLSKNEKYRLLLVDDFTQEEKKPNWQNIPNAERLSRSKFLEHIQRDTLQMQPDWIVHLGARTDTTEMDYEIHRSQNLEYSKAVWEYTAWHSIDLVYASSAATYGDGALGYSDAEELAEKLQPLNPYGVSKNEFDKWAIAQTDTPSHWYGLKFFNVYGPHENHKGRMASVVFHAHRQISDSGSMVLFRSHHPEYKDGEQKRDFVFVEDVVDVICWLMESKPDSGIYNMGTGQARTFMDLAQAVFQNMKVAENIQWRDTPEDIRDKYQYFTEADMSKLRAAGYTKPFRTLEEGIAAYVRYLESLS